MQCSLRWNHVAILKSGKMERLGERVGNIVQREENDRRKYMSDKYSKSNINNVSGNIFNGPTNIMAGNSYSREHEEDKVALYTS